MFQFSSIDRNSFGHQIMALRMGKAGALFLWVRNEHPIWRRCILYRRSFASRRSSSAKLHFKRALGPSMRSVVTRVYTSRSSPTLRVLTLYACRFPG